MQVKTLIDLLAEVWGGYEEYNARVDEEVAVQINDRWYVTRAGNASNLEHSLSVFGTDGKDRIRFTEDTGRCGNGAVVTRPRTIQSEGAKPVMSPPSEMLRFRWNGALGNDDTRLFYGGFERVENV